MASNNKQVNMEEQVKTDPLTLTTLANELLIDVFQTLPQANLKVLYAVCRKLRDFIKNNGSFICKMRVVPHYQDAIALLGLEKVSYILIVEWQTTSGMAY